MSVLPLHRTVVGGLLDTTDVDVVVPVYNEADQLAASVTRLRRFLDDHFPFEAAITIADNASTDDTWRIATGLAATLPLVRAVHLDQKGRGRALRTAWSRSTATVVAYMDVDLATGLDALLPLVAPLLSGHSDVAIGTRLAPGAHVVRGARREFISRCYNLLLRTALHTGCSDAQCGFKAVRRDAAERLLPLVEDQAWFFDTELLVTAERLGLRIHEVPVDWVDDLDSRVKVAATAWEDLRGVARLLGRPARRRTVAAGAGRRGRVTRGRGARRPAPGGTGPVFADELLRFAGVGVVSTAAYLLLFAALTPLLGAYAASATAIVACGLGNTAAHRGLVGSPTAGGTVRRVATTVGLVGVSLAATTGALAAVRAAGGATLAPEVAAVTVANLAAAVVRFGILRTWVFRPTFGTALAGDGEAR